MDGQLARGPLVIKSANLYRPAAPVLNRHRSLQHFDADFRRTLLQHANLFCRGLGKINNSSFNEGSAVGDPDHRRGICTNINHTHN